MTKYFKKVLAIPKPSKNILMEVVGYLFLAALKEIWHIPDHKDTMQSQMHAYKQSLKYAYNHASKQPSTHTHTPHMICKSLVQFPKIDLFVTGT